MKSSNTYKVKIEVIFSFRQINEQKIHILEFDYIPSEAQFLFSALSLLSSKDQAELYKISACGEAICSQITEDLSSALQWLINSNGKYYFGV
jgi:hypothetical protein